MATLASALAGHQRVALDTPVWIYHLEGSTVYGRAADSVLEAVAQERVRAVASELLLLELLVAPLKKGLQDAADGIELELVHFPNLDLIPVTREILLRAAEIRAHYELRTPDAIMLATAAESGATLVITNDSAWRRIREIDVVLLRDLK